MISDFEKIIKIEKRKIGENQPCYIVAEAGVAHFGSFEKAKKLIDLAKKSKADAVKFQIFNTEKLIAKSEKKWRKRLGSRVLNKNDFKKLKEYSKKKGITFFATPHDEESLEFLDSIDVPAFKIGSGEINNHRFIKKIALKGKPIILSTGMYNKKEISETIKIISKTGNRKLAILHCVTAYPTKPSEVNLKSIKYLKENFNVIVGYSDHTKGFHIPIAAFVLGAKIIEKHISLDFNVKNAQDWKVSCDENSMIEFVKNLREIEVALGKEKKVISKIEKENMLWARKSLVLKSNHKKGYILKEKDIIEKRPGTGIAPNKIKSIIGKKIKRDLEADSIIMYEDIEK